MTISQRLVLHVEAAKNGSAQDQLSLGKMYFHGENCEQDYSKAVYYFNAVIENTNRADYLLDEAFCLLGQCYYTGKGVELNQELGKHYIQKAADRGFWKAQCRLDDIKNNVDGNTWKF